MVALGSKIIDYIIHIFKHYVYYFLEVSQNRWNLVPQPTPDTEIRSFEEMDDPNKRAADCNINNILGQMIIRDTNYVYMLDAVNWSLSFVVLKKKKDWNNIKPEKKVIVQSINNWNLPLSLHFQKEYLHWKIFFFGHDPRVT